MKSIWDLKHKETAVIMSYSHNLSEYFQKRLFDLGFRVGESVTCRLVPSFQAPKIFDCKEGSFAIEKDLAKEILCE